MTNRSEKEIRSQKTFGIFLSYVAIFVNVICQLIYTPILIRKFGASEYGLFNLVHSVVGYLNLFGLGFSGAYIRFHALLVNSKDEKRVDQLNGMFLSVLMILSAMACLVGFLLPIQSMFGNKLSISEVALAKVLLYIMVVNLALTLPISLFESYIIAYEKFLFHRMLGVVRMVLMPFISIPLVLFGYRSVAVTLVTTIITVFYGLSCIIYAVYKLKMRFAYGKADRSLFAEISRFCFFVFLNQVVDQINWSSDKVLLGITRGSVSVAVYAVASSINSVYMQLSTAVSNVFVPEINRLVAKGNQEAVYDIFVKVGRIQFIVLSYICCGIIFFGKPFMCFYAGKEYIESYYVLLLLVIPVTFPLVQNTGIEIQRAMNKHQFRSVVYFFIALINLFISFPLAKRWGTVGAAMGTSLAVLVGNILVMNVYYHKKMGLNVIAFWKEIFMMGKGLVIPVIGGILLYLFTDIYSLFGFALGIIVFTGVFMVSALLFSINCKERQMILRYVMHK